MSRYRCVDDQKAAGFLVTAACEAAGVSTSGYYDWPAREAHGPTERQLADDELIELMREIPRRLGRELRGAPDVHRAAPSRAGREQEKSPPPDAPGRPRRSWPAPAVPHDVPRAGDLRHPGPGPALPLPRRAGRGVGRRTLPTSRPGKGWLFFASVLDLGSRRLLGYSMADHMRTGLVLDALTMAVAARGGAAPA